MSGLLPLSQSENTILSNKESVLKRLPVGKPIQPPNRSSPCISRRIITDDNLLAEIWEWAVTRKAKETKDKLSEEDKQLYINSVLQEIFGIISQKEECLKDLFSSLSTLSEDDHINETKHVMQLVRERLKDTVFESLIKVNLMMEKVVGLKNI